jgi:toxin ParE1/3/4
MTPFRRRLAVLDIEQATEYYEVNAGDAVAMDFLDDLEATLETLCRLPGAGSPKYGERMKVEGLRSQPLGHFPYVILYVPRLDRLEVWRVLHGRRDIPSRLKGGD